jgi:phage baseplate assembly protein W
LSRHFFVINKKKGISMAKRELPSSLNKVSYKDFDLSFRRHPSTGKLLVKKNDDAVKQAVKNLVLTNRYERPFHPEFGGDVRARLFDNFNSISSSIFQEQISTAIGNYEPRVKLEKIDNQEAVSIREYPDENGLAVTIRFRSVATLNDVTLDVNLNKVR